MEYHSQEDAPRVLVVDDEKVIREILADFLSMEGFTVRTAEDGSAALVELSRQHYDLVLSDLKMPNMGGLELLAAISKHAPNVVTVIMTGFGTVETAIDAMKRGAYDYILKPFKVEEVVHTIRRGLEKRKLHRREPSAQRGALPLQGQRGHRGEPLARRGDAHGHGRGHPRGGRGPSVVVVLDDGEGGFFERALRAPPGLSARARAWASSTRRGLADYFPEDRPLRVHGQHARGYFAHAARATSCRTR